MPGDPETEKTEDEAVAEAETTTETGEQSTDK